MAKATSEKSVTEQLAAPLIFKMNKGGEFMTICNRCKKDHKIKNTGPLTVCETEGYLKQGTPVNRPGQKTANVFGGGQQRYQHQEAK